MEKKTKYPGIYKTPDGYRIRVYGKDPKTGRIKEVDRVFQGVTLEQAIGLQAELRVVIAQGGETNATPQQTLSAYVQSWLKRRSAHYKLSTLQGKVLSMERHVLPHLGDIYLDKLNQGDIEQWMQRLRTSRNERGQCFSPGTVNYAWRVLRTVLRDAVAELDLARDPTLRVRSLPEEAKDTDDPNVLTSEEIPRFLKAMQNLFPQHYALTFIGLTTGMRFGELTALTWKDVNEEEGVIRVTKAQFRGVVSTTKTGKVRSVPLTEEMIKVLREHRRELVAKQHPGLDEGLVFPSDTGRFHYPSLLAHPFKRACKAAGINRRFTPHGMRRTFNTLMLKAGVDHVVLRATIGHSSEAMTEHYAHVSLEAKHEGAKRLMALIGGKADD